jgi:hypothetical protein
MRAFKSPVIPNDTPEQGEAETALSQARQLFLYRLHPVETESREETSTMLMLR